MRYLLDTHTMLWFLEDSAKLPTRLRKELLKPRNARYVSTVSLWEVAIKMAISKLTFDGGFDALCDAVTRSGISVLPVSTLHIRGVVALPFVHKDPFDRLLISTALSENMTIITADENIHKYNVSCIWQ